MGDNEFRTKDILACQGHGTESERGLMSLLHREELGCHLGDMITFAEGELQTLSALTPD
jgi:hypothetical protein